MAMQVLAGQYVPGDSAVHRLDARVKIALGVAYAGLLFAVRGWPGLAAGAVIAVAAALVASVPWRALSRGLVPIAWLLALTFALNSLVWNGADALVALGPLGVSAAGLARGAYYVARIGLLVFGTSLVTVTTAPVALTDALSRIMRPLRHLRVPVEDVAMMFSIALRFIPIMAEEADKIVTAQRARGAAFAEGGPIRRTKAWMPVLIPLFVGLFRRADDLAIAMESRCYVGVGRTRMNEGRMRSADWAVLVAGVTLMTVVAILLP
jgi:energy-coupling factor transport system permease protein